MPPLLRVFCWSLLAFFPSQSGAAPQFLEDRFELPADFRIYRVAGADLCGGSYDIVFDGQGRLLIGDGNAVRRLADRDADGVYDHFEVIATGLGWRGPQGLLVWDDRLYAVGGDGIQLLEGYRSGGPLVHRRRLGNPLKTGGDHEAHTILRGWDDHLYFVTGDGGGVKDRSHITEATSPVPFAREASVFRISPDGQRWECIGTGGRNPPNLGQNYLGEFFSLDSDMEWHVGLPWWRPVRLNHWLWGGDQGWQEVGAHPPYYPDSLPGICDVGRGSPNWGVFYEHTQLPPNYRDAFLVCDYRWKRESADQYHTTGRLLALVLKRRGAGWEAAMEVLVRPKPEARDAAGNLIQFALVDIEVAPDGSLFVSDHNQGVWRIIKAGANPSLVFPPRALPDNAPAASDEALLEEMLNQPQPSAEWSRLRIEALRAKLGARFETGLQAAALNARRAVRARLNAIRLLAPEQDRLPDPFLADLTRDAQWEMRAQSAWLLGLRGKPENSGFLLKLLEDEDPFVRRRAAEAFTRIPSGPGAEGLIQRLADPDRLVRYAAMAALAQRPASEWLSKAIAEPSLQTGLRALIAARLRREGVPNEAVYAVISRAMNSKAASKEDELDLLRALALFKNAIEANPALRTGVAEFLSAGFPSEDRALRFEQVRLLGEYGCTNVFAKLLNALALEPDPVFQFHLAQTMARLPSGWTDDEEQRLIDWLHRTQRGWFAQFSGKGVEFPHFWSTVLAQMAAHHGPALLRDFSRIDFNSALGQAVMNLLTQVPDGADRLIGIYQATSDAPVKRRALMALGRIEAKRAAHFLQIEYHRLDPSSPAGAALAAAILLAWAERPDLTTLPFVIFEGLFHEQAEMVRASADAIRRSPAEARRIMAEGQGPVGREPQADLAADILAEMLKRPQLFAAYDHVLSVWSGQARTNASGVDARLDEAARAAAIAHWKAWFKQQFKRDFVPPAEAMMQKSDEAIHAFLLGQTSRDGDPARGATVYEKAQCHACHGGGAVPGREGTIFGPDLAGVTRRLSRHELADALVYPAKQVGERFKAVEIELKNGELRTGFVTEDTPEAVTLVQQEQVRRILRADIKALRSQSASLMPSGLLNVLSWEEIRDLLAFLEEGLSAGATGRK